MREGQDASIYWQPEWEAHRGACGSDVPRVSGEELVQAMRTNVAEALANLAKARTNLHRLRLAGNVVFDERSERLRPQIIGEGKRKRLDPFGDVGISDWLRAVAEVAHWQEYLEWAKGQRDAAPGAVREREPGEDDE